MKQAILVVAALGAGLGAGFLLGRDEGTVRNSGSRGESVEVSELREISQRDQAELDRLRALVADLKRRLAEMPETPSAANPYPDDTPEAVEQLLEEAYAENNVDWLLDVIERLLRMGDRGYPILRRMIEDIVWKRKFLPSQSDFQVGHFYRFARVFANLERQFIGFIDYLLKEPQTHPIFRQVAMMGGAFYVGSRAPGTDELKQTMMQIFLQQSGGAMPGFLPGNAGNKMRVFAMAMSGDKQMIEPLRSEYKTTRNKDMQSDIIGALAYLGDPQTVPLIKERLDPTQGNWRREIQALGRVGTPEAHETATQFLRTIPDTKRFYKHARDYMRAGGGTGAVVLMKERFLANPSDKEIGNSIGSLRRFPTPESLETLNVIATQSPDQEIARRATDAAANVGARLRGEIPEMPAGKGG